MALHFTRTTPTVDDLTLSLRFGAEAGPEQTEIRQTSLPAEWFPQSGIQLTWPHEDTDWRDMLDDVLECYVRMAFEIASRERLLIVTPEPEDVETLLRQRLPERVFDNIRWCRCDTNDTWARDHGFITLLTESGPALLDFRFNGWGMKFPANHDNCINRHLMEGGFLNGAYENRLDFVLEGGSIESDGRGTLLTTTECLLSDNRNEYLNRMEIENRLKQLLHAERVLWLENGYLAGDDTDGHVDMLARLCPNDTIAYVQCTDRNDEHYQALQAMEEELRAFRTKEEQPYRLIPLPMATPIYDGDYRLPASYANFLILNGAVLMPTYAQPANDKLAAERLQQAFPKYEIIGIDCRVLIRNHGSLHCSTMQFPLGVLK